MAYMWQGVRRCVLLPLANRYEGFRLLKEKRFMRTTESVHRFENIV